MGRNQQPNLISMIYHHVNAFPHMAFAPCIFRGVQAKEVPPAEGSTMGVKDVDAKKPLVKPEWDRPFFQRVGRP